MYAGFEIPDLVGDAAREEKRLNKENKPGIILSFVDRTRVGTSEGGY